MLWEEQGCRQTINKAKRRREETPDAARAEDMGPVAVGEAHSSHVHAEKTIGVRSDIVVIIIGGQALLGEKQKMQAKI